MCTVIVRHRPSVHSIVGHESMRAAITAHDPFQRWSRVPASSVARSIAFFQEIFS